MATGKVTEAIDEITPKTPGALRVIFKKPAGNKTSLSLGSIDEWDYITKEMFESNPQGVIKTPINKVGADIDVNGFIDVSANVDNTFDLIGIYQNGGAIYADIKFDPLALTVGPFDTSTPSGDTILLRFI